MEIFFIILGIAGLVVGAELTIKGAMAIARRYNLSYAFVGLTILALGTDLPELFIVLSGSFHKLAGIEMSDFILGEIIGSAVAQITVVLGVLGLLGLVAVNKKRLFRDGGMMVLSVVIMYLFGLDGQIQSIEGIFMVLIFLLYIWRLSKDEKVKKNTHVPHTVPILWGALSLFGGFFVLLYFSDMTLKNALLLSTKYAIPQYIVGFLIVGLGTSLPELVTSIVAVKRKAVGMAVGNLFGSNIVDILFIVGVGSAIAPNTIHPSLIKFDIPSLFLISVLVVLLFLFSKKLPKTGSVLLIVIYVLFVLWKLSLLLF
tara:strand:+ start:159 stop:1100 length:942 start_codon:yes stop_codon:yes gene_type:complete